MVPLMYFKVEGDLSVFKVEGDLLQWCYFLVLVLLPVYGTEKCTADALNSELLNHDHLNFSPAQFKLQLRTQLRKFIKILSESTRFCRAVYILGAMSTLLCCRIQCYLI